LVNVAGIVTALAYAIAQLAALAWPVSVGLDFVPLRNAGASLLAGRSVYGDHDFVYPPTAAWVLAPTSLGSVDVAFAAWLGVSGLALVIAVIQIARAASRRYRIGVAASAGMVLTGGCVASDALWLGNLSVLLVPVAVASLLAFHRERWTLGCGLLMCSLLVKPLLVGLLLVPLLRRQWKALALTLGVGLTTLLIAAATVPGGESFSRVLMYCASATNLHGDNAVNNLSLRGWAEAHHQPALVGVVGAVVVAVAGVRVMATELQSASSLAAIRVGAIVFCITLLSGTISEVHYLLTLAAITITWLAVSPTRRNVAVLAPGIAMLALPTSCVDLLLNGSHARQSWYVAAELVVLTGLCSSRSPLRPAHQRVRAAGAMAI
jgi:hypothetical protein